MDIIYLQHFRVGTPFFEQCHTRIGYNTFDYLVVYIHIIFLCIFLNWDSVCCHSLLVRTATYSMMKMYYHVKYRECKNSLAYRIRYLLSQNEQYLPFMIAFHGVQWNRATFSHTNVLFHNQQQLPLEVPHIFDTLFFLKIIIIFKKTT